MEILKNIFVAIFALFFIVSCNKEPVANNESKQVSPFGLLETVLEAKDADFFVTVTSSYNSSIYGRPGFIQDKTSIYVESASKDEINVGSLFVNDKQIPFYDLNYGQQVEPSEKVNFIGTTNNYKLNAIDGFPSFETEAYSINSTHLFFEGLDADLKLPRNSQLILSWTPENQMPENGKAAVIIFSEDEDGNFSENVFYREVNDESGQFTIDASEFNIYHEYPFVRLFYVRGYNKYEDILDKILELNFLTFSYTHIYFSN